MSLPCADQPCPDCPWRVSNRGKVSPPVEGKRYGWFDLANLKRLWEPIRRGEMMTCHSTDPEMIAVLGRPVPDGVKVHVCAGATIVRQREMMILQEKFEANLRSYRLARPRGLMRAGIEVLINQFFFERPKHQPNLNELDIQYEPLGIWPENRTIDA